MAAISGESIMGAGKESSDQARRKAIVMKAATLGIKTKGMRLLQPDVEKTRSARTITPIKAATTVDGTDAVAPRRARKRRGETTDVRTIEDELYRDVDVGEMVEAAGSPLPPPEERSKPGLITQKKRRKAVSGMVPTVASGGLAAIASMY